jgi:hypothetical protein
LKKCDLEIDSKACRAYRAKILVRLITVNAKAYMALFIVFALALVPFASAQNVHGWEWSVNKGESFEYEMVLSYEALSDTRQVYINITSLSDLSSASGVSDIQVDYNITYTDHSQLNPLYKSLFENYFATLVALPTGNWSAISGESNGLLRGYFSIAALLATKQVTENATYFGYNADYSSQSLSFGLNTTWDKSDGSLYLYNLTFSETSLGSGSVSLLRMAPPKPSALDNIIAWVQDNMVLVIVIVVVLCIVAGFANKK